MSKADDFAMEFADIEDDDGDLDLSTIGAGERERENEAEWHGFGSCRRVRSRGVMEGCARPRRRLPST